VVFLSYRTNYRFFSLIMGTITMAPPIIPTTVNPANSSSAVRWLSRLGNGGSGSVGSSGWAQRSHTVVWQLSQSNSRQASQADAGGDSTNASSIEKIKINFMCQSIPQIRMIGKYHSAPFFRI